MSLEPYLIDLPKIPGINSQLTFFESGADFPIVIKQVYWIYDVDTTAVRGNHAHANADRVIICLNGEVEVIIENIRGEKQTFILNDPSKALYFPRLHWIRLNFSKGSVLIAFSSCSYQDDIVIKDYQEFRKFNAAKSLQA